MKDGTGQFHQLEILIILLTQTLHKGILLYILQTDDLLLRFSLGSFNVMDVIFLAKTWKINSKRFFICNILNHLFMFLLNSWWWSPNIEKYQSLYTLFILKERKVYVSWMWVKRTHVSLETYCGRFMWIKMCKPRSNNTQQV